MAVSAFLLKEVFKTLNFMQLGTKFGLSTIYSYLCALDMKIFGIGMNYRNHVVEMQEKLKKLGYLSEVTGEFDSATVEAVKNFQRRNSLSVTGKADSETLRSLYSGSANPAW